MFFYYFGHGHVISGIDPTHDRAFLVPIDVPNPVANEQNFERAAFPITQMIQYATQGSLKHTFFAFEACKAGAIVGALAGPAPPNPKGYLLSDGILNEVHQFLTAGNEVQDVPADNSFTALVAAALSDPAADGNMDGYITGKEVMNYVVTRLPQWKEYPLNPEAGWRPPSTTGDFIFGPVDPQNPSRLSSSSTAGSNTPQSGSGGPLRVSSIILDGEKRRRGAIDVLGNKSNSVLLHVDAILELGSIARDVPELAKKIAEDLALTAVTYSSPHLRDEAPSITGDISPETGAALKEIGGMSVMKAGLPLQLQLGNFRGAKLPTAYLNGIDLSGTDLTGSDLYRAQLYNANLPYSVLSGSNLAGALLSHAAFYGALLCEAHNTAVPDLSRQEVVSVQLSGANLQDAHFDGAWMVGAELGSDVNADDRDRTNMVGAHFNDANLQGADLSYSNLDNSDFRGANLTDSNFTGSSIRNIVVDKNTKFCRTMWIDGKKRSDSCRARATAPPEKHPECIKAKTWRELVALVGQQSSRSEAI